MRAAAALGVLAILCLTNPAEAQGRSDKSIYPELQGWKNPYSGHEQMERRERRETRGGLGIRRPRQTDTLGTPREPLGGDPWAPRSRRY